ncbi:MAG TPA: hypothetical protein PKY87_16345 [Terricaulis sp.]|nr:hypothetical protein [Terricaulis sp.]
MASLAAASPASAQSRDRGVFQPNTIMPAQGRGDDNRRQQAEIRPLREVVNELRAQHGGEYIAHRLEDGGRPFYVIRWRMPDGQVRDFRVSASR